ncbi:hypothetical protein Afil01_45020 [Actinorhabdospora filicis]|uniref:HEAT repeat domain-containing protein n=1 Tax=Actinorhabdospora filicis TaxID=1785913 RepID=A0A9W6SPM2_9ACTN|nr:hypothetical protein [Actinorhabdospora filicis]GLZ79695.1 hypothetical protein Afil01_45020 [Actinorhabdospora filicis]
MLDGLDDIDWGALRHNYGSAGDVPGLLRAHAAGEEPDDDLRNLLYHQGGWVPSAATAALPFLVELAGTPGTHERPDMLEIVGELAQEATWSRHVDPGWAAAWVAVLPRVTALLGDPEPRIRSAAAQGLAACGEHGPLRARFPAETDPMVRVEIATYLIEAGDDLRGDPSPEVRLISLVAAGAEAEGVYDALIATDPAVLSAWGDETTVVRRMGADARPGFVHRLLTAGRGLSAAAVLLSERRDLDGEFAGAIATLSPDPDALRLLAVLSVPCPALFAGLIDDPEVGDIAVWALARLGDERVIAPLVRRVREDSWHHTRAHFTGTHRVGDLPSIGEVLQALPRERVAAVLPAVRERLRLGGGQERLDYLNTLIAWGALAVEALPEVAALDPPLARRAEEAIRDAPARPAAEELTASDEWTRVRAARAEWRSTGDHTVAARVLVAVVTGSLDGGQASPAARAALVHLGEMGAREAAAPLARRVLDHVGGLHHFGGWRAFTEDGEWRRAAQALL